MFAGRIVWSGVLGVVVRCLSGEGELGGGWAVEDDAVGPFDEQGHTIGGHGEFQPVAVDEAMVEPTQKQKVADLMVSTVFAVFQMVNIAPAWRVAASVVAAVPVADEHGPPVSYRNAAYRGANIERNTFPRHEHGRERRVATHRVTNPPREHRS